MDFGCWGEKMSPNLMVYLPHGPITHFTYHCIWGERTTVLTPEECQVIVLITLERVQLSMCCRASDAL